MRKANPCLHAHPHHRPPADEDNAAWLQSEEAREFLSAHTASDEKTGCLIWTGRTQKRFAYGYFYRRTRIIYAHRAAYIAAHGPIAKGLVVCHTCDNPSCIAIEHLRLGTQQDNLADMWSKGRGRWRSLLNRAQVLEIKRRLASAESVASIARDVGVGRGVIQAIKSGRTWGHLHGGTPNMPKLAPPQTARGPRMLVETKKGEMIIVELDQSRKIWMSDMIPLLRTSEE